MSRRSTDDAGVAVGLGVGVAVRVTVVLGSTVESTALGVLGGMVLLGSHATASAARSRTGNERLRSMQPAYDSRAAELTHEGDVGLLERAAALDRCVEVALAGEVLHLRE